MVVAFDPTGDFLYFDKKRTVSLLKVAPDTGTLTTYTAVRALRMSVSELPTAMGQVQFMPRRARWHIDVSTLDDGVKPARGDRIVDTTDGSTETWVIEGATLETVGTRWRCDTQERVTA